MKLDKNFFFSQHALNMFRMCPIRFRNRYIEGLYWRGTQFQEKRMERGKHFHILADRYFSDIPMRMEFFEEYGELNEWIDALKEYMPKKDRGEYYSEYQIKVDSHGMRLQAKYDLIYVAPDGKIIIYDWKTQERPMSYKAAQGSMQTKVYRYVMALGGERLRGEDIAPEDIIMRYWQPKFPQNTIELSYSRRQFEEDGDFLKKLISSIKSFDYENYDTLENDKYCSRCEFNYFCNADKVKYSSIFAEEEIELDDWDDVEDIHF